MPLTLAHPAAVMPLKRSGLPFSALIVGSMAPDLEYLFHLSPRGEIGHTLSGLVLFCAPVGLVTLWLAHRLWSAPMAAILLGTRSRSTFTFWPASRFFGVFLAILIGAVTHLAWDSFTHPLGWMVQHLPTLSIPLLQTHWGSLRIYKLLQHASTLLGLIVITAVAMRQEDWAPFHSLRWARLTGLALPCVAGGLLISLLRNGLPSDFDSMRTFIGIGVVGFFDVGLVAVTAVSLLWHIQTGRGT